MMCSSGPPWVPGKTALLICFRELFLAQDHAAARTAQRLVGGGGDHVRVRNRVLMQSCCDQAGDVRHVDKQVSADLLAISANLSKRISRG